MRAGNSLEILQAPLEVRCPGELCKRGPFLHMTSDSLTLDSISTWAHPGHNSERSCPKCPSLVPPGPLGSCHSRLSLVASPLVSECQACPPHWLPAALPSPSPSPADALRPVLASLAPAHPFPCSAFGPTTRVFQIRRCRLFSWVLLQGPQAGPGGGVLRTYVSFLHRADMCSAIPQASLTYRNQ